MVSRELGIDRAPNADRFDVELPSWFVADLVLPYLGRDPASLTERVSGRVFAFATTVDGTPVAVRVELAPGVARCRVERAGAPFAGDLSGVETRVLRYLGLGIDPRPFERRASRDVTIRRLIAGRRGLSIPQTPTLFDAFVWVIAGQQVSLAVAFALRRRLTRRLGVHVGDGLHVPPTPESVAQLDHGELRQLSFSRRKAEYLLDVARAIVDGSFELDRLPELSASELEGRLLAVRGLGPWSVSYLMMRSLGLADCVPVGDAALTRNLRRFFGLEARPDAGETRRLMEPFAPHRSLATFHLWALKEESQ